MSSGLWSIERRPSVIRTGRVTSMTTLTLLGGHRTSKQPEITPPNLGIQSIGGGVATDLCLTLFG